MIMEAISENPDQPDPKGAILSESFAIVFTYEHNQTKRTKQKCLTGGKRGKGPLTVVMGITVYRCL